MYGENAKKNIKMPLDLITQFSIAEKYKVKYKNQLYFYM